MAGYPRTQARRQPCLTAGKPSRSLHLSALGREDIIAGECLLPLSMAATKSSHLKRKDLGVTQDA